jgi:hypothetical protein
LFARAQSLQQIYNVLYARIASDEEFLDSILSAETAVGRVDEFVGELWKIWKEVRNEKPAQVCPVLLLIFYHSHTPLRAYNWAYFDQTIYCMSLTANWRSSKWSSTPFLRPSERCPKVSKVYTGM